MPEYKVFSHAQSGVRFGKDDKVVLENFPSSYGPVNIVVRTRLKRTDTGKVVPIGLTAEVQGHAPSLLDSAQNLAHAAQSICPVFAFIGNAPIADMCPEVAYEVAPGIRERDYFQLFHPEQSALHIDRRRISSEVAVRFLHKFLCHPEAERIRRALGQYYQALRNWEPGQEALAVSHLWMGVEALSPVVLRRTMQTTGNTRAELASTWGVEDRKLDAEVRRRLILLGDTDTYTTARKASDGFEHGFLGFAEVHAQSSLVRSKLADYLRKSILNELALDAMDTSTMTVPPYDKPGHLRLVKYLRGKLISSDESLVAEGQTHPFLQWKTEVREVPNLGSESAKFILNESFTGVFAAGVSINIQNIEVLAGMESSLKAHSHGESSTD